MSIADISLYRTMQKDDCEVYESRFNVTLSRYILLSVSHKSFAKKWVRNEPTKSPNFNNEYEYSLLTF